MSLYFIVCALTTFSIIKADITVCQLKNRKGICIPWSHCHDERVFVWWDCGRKYCCLNPTIPRQKCHEYHREVYGDLADPASFKKTQNKIIGGEIAKIQELPHMAAVGFESVEQGGIRWVCGGSIISHNFILSAAHCFTLRVFKTWTFVGAVNLDDPNGILRAVSDIIRHPMYESWNHHYDIALLRLEKELTFSSHVHPACLLYEQEVRGLTTTTAAGWGKTHEDAKGGVNELWKVDVDMYYLNECKKYHPVLDFYGGMLPSMICAGNISGDQDTCQGDSGGPLVIPMEGYPGFYGIVGITSTGSAGCGNPNSPSIYTRISYFLTWLVKTTWPTET